MPKELKLVSPAAQFAQKVKDLDEQRAVEESMGMPESVKIQDAANAMKSAEPRPTIYNVNTGEWEEVTPSQGRLRGIPLGPPNPSIIDRMWRDEGMTRPLLMSDAWT